jgi:nucleotide-binding universal stress UspA family protein
MKTSDSHHIERILCPFDFSETARIGLAYAVQLGKVFDASLTLFSVQTSATPDTMQLYEDQNDSSKALRRQLKIEALQIQTQHGISCDTFIESTDENSAFTIGEASAAYDLTVVGTDGTDDLYQHIFGDNTHHRLGLAKCPVLLVPPACPTRLPHEIFYAFDPETNPRYLLTDLEILSEPLKAKVRSLYIVPEPVDELVAASQFPEAMIGMHGRWGFDWDFDPICSDEIISALDRHMKSRKNSMLALSCHHRALFEGMFQDQVMGEISRLATYPVLVFWH